jgi:hypothetical protein
MAFAHGGILSHRTTKIKCYDQPNLYSSEMRFGYAAGEYSLINPLRMFLRRARAEARSTTAGPVSGVLGGRWSRLWRGLCSL